MGILRKLLYNVEIDSRLNKLGLNFSEAKKIAELTSRTLKTPRDLKFVAVHKTADTIYIMDTSPSHYKPNTTYCQVFEAAEPRTIAIEVYRTDKRGVVDRLTNVLVKFKMK